MTFRELNLNTPLINALDDLSLNEPTAIQQQAFAPIMAGKDVLGIAQTGTGKTFAYLIPLIRLWQFNKKKTPEIIILVPTRELVVQVVEEFQKLIKYTSIKVTGAYGGANIKGQAAEILAGVDAVVATPGRLMDLILNGAINANSVKKLVIDEVDEMMNLGFRAQLKNLIDLLPVRRQTLMFSATMTDEIDLLIASSFNTPIKIEAAVTGTPVSNIDQQAFEVPNYSTKINFLEHLLSSDKSMKKVLVFAGSKRLADRVNSNIAFKFPDQIAVIHANKSQNTRFKTVDQFENGECRILIASDLLARGLDVSEVSHVINMDVPDVAENYMHRIGRTGRADKKGKAITFITEKEKASFKKIEALMEKKIPLQALPAKVEISDVLIPDEIMTPGMKVVKVRAPKLSDKGLAFHEKKGKNKKVPIKVTKVEKMKLKYGKQYGTKHGKAKKS
jgi:ATP-dependent RNA helicase RhlE